jgi:hypothetical protein
MEDYNSTQNQQIKGQFVDKHIYAGATQIVEFVLHAGAGNEDAPFQYEELEDTNYFEGNDGAIYSPEEKEEQLEEWKRELEEVEDKLLEDEANADLLEMQNKLMSDIESLEDAEQQFMEIYEWWIVSRYLGEKLKQHHQPVLEDGQNYYWGRCTTGQAILLDAVISRICEEMQILHGQKHSWLP